MWLQTKLAVTLVAVPLALASPPLWAQGVGHYLAPLDQVVAIRAKHLFDSHSGNLLDNQVVLVHGERIAEVGSAIQIPSGATIMDLGSATVLPGMIGRDFGISGTEQPYTDRASVSLVGLDRASASRAA
jgi:hypothetical protein